MSASKNILVVLTGSIACYKVCHVISRLVQAGAEVQVVATPSALQFVGSATLEGLSGKPVISDMYASGNVMEHIHLMRWADLILVAPATANFINKASQGVSDDLVQTLFLAHNFKRPFLVAPAMNTSMYLHPATQKSLKTLIQMGVEILETASGVLACGEQGWGKLLDPELILQAVHEKLQNTNGLPDSPATAAESPKIKTQKILISAGGTQEAIDSVRTISNLSSGRTGLRLAEYFENLGFDVTLLKSHSSPQTQVQKSHVFTDFQSLNQLSEKILSTESFDYLIHAAAVSDYSLDSIELENQILKPLEVRKLNSEAESMKLVLKRNPKIVDSLKSYSKNKNLKVIAFKLTSGASAEERLRAVKKLFSASSCDFVVHNDLSEIDISRKRHHFTVYQSDLTSEPCEGIAQLCGNLSQTLLKDMI